MRRRGNHFGGGFGAAVGGLAFGLGALLGSTALSSPPPPAPFTMPHFGISNPNELVGPNGDEAQFLTPRGFDLAPSGPGVSRYVDPGVVSSGDGLTPATAYKTAQEALDSHTEGDLILLKGGYPYPEALIAAAYDDVRATAANPVKIAKWGSGPAPEITAADAPGGWLVCSTPAEGLGNPYFAKIFYTDVTPSADVPIEHAVLLENGEVGSVSMRAESMVTTDDMLIPQHKTLWYNGDDAGSSIADLTKSGTTGVITIGSAEFASAEHPQGSLDGCRVLLNGVANKFIDVPLISHNAATGELVFDNTDVAWEGKEMALRNLPAGITAAGQWASRDNGNGTWRIWYWPHDPANINDVRISQRKVCVDLNAAEHVRFFGLKFTGAGGAWPQDGRGATAVYSTQHNIYQRNNVIFEQCHAIGHNVGGFNLTNINGAGVYDCTSEKIIIGRAADFTKCQNTVVLGNHFALSGFTSVSLYSQLNTLFAFNHIEEVRSVHGNGASIYLTAKNLWYHANLVETRFAIATTMQDSANVYFTCNVVKLAPDIAMRGLEDNSNFPAGYVRTGQVKYSEVLAHFPTPGRIVWVCNTFLPWEGADPATVTAAIQLMNTTHCDHVALANLIFGSINLRNGTITDTDADPDVTYVATTNTLPGKNVFMGTGATGHEVLSNGEGNSLVADPAAVLVDPVSNPTPVELGPADASAGDLTAHLPLSESWFTNLPDAVATVSKDFARNDILWSNAPRGAVRGPSVSTVPTAATNMLLSSESVPENATIGTVVGGIIHNGTLPATLSITADPDNKFDLLGTDLVTTATFDRGVKTSHSVTIRVDNTAAGGGVYSKSFSIAVAVPAAWLPSTLANLAIWLDPSDLSTMRQERNGAAATTPVAVGDPVGTIRDKSANGYYLTAASDAARPILRQSGALHYLEFDGVDSRLELPAGAMTQLAQPNFIGMTADFIEDGAGRFFDGGSGTVRHILAATGTTEFYLHAGSWAGPYTTRTPGTPQAVTTLWNGASSYTRIDAGAEQAGSVGAYPLQGLYLGEEYNGSNPAEMNLFSLVVNDGDLTTAQRGNLDAYLAAKGGI